ncbi:DJ-1/PfpI family protein [Demequina sp. NBRC 110057]|uniref:DJ-1/PfpI family protein n=1 Tax=Demequina sp. NBRC 110057 TaxID=1570346 RepID=UPI000A04EC6F|nr:DJ-1/PfpI family protein [Demequina sp. NBRC 110057]
MTRIGILVYDGFDLIDAGGPYEVFLTAARLQQRAGEDAGFEVALVSPGGADAVAFGGMTLTALGAAEEAGPFDVVVIPGTIDVAAAAGDPRIAAAVAALVSGAGLTTSVCTGSFLLARGGILAGLPATTHWEDVADLAREEVADAVAGMRWVDAGDVVTSGGLTSGIHMALHVVARVAGVDLAHATARQLDMDWSASPER